MYDRAMEKKSLKYLDELIQIYKDSEISTIPVRLTELRSEVGALAKTLALDLKQSIGNQNFKIYYQPQFDNHNNCIGVEALLRWKHPVYGMIYPPLVIKLAQEMNMLPDFERMIIELVFTEAPQIHHAIKHHCKISANVTVETLRSEGFEAFLQEVMNVYGSPEYDLCIEITEQMALKADDDIEKLMARIRQMGYKLAIDDFSMGHTSLKYLQSSQFDIVKLDGALVRNLNTNTRSKDIVKSIVYLSKSLGFSILAEYVETREIQALLEEIGCLQYQGYLYGAAVPLDYFTAAMYGKN
jgi:EAL domain-containing protein (putative c-di-GMP-specific phosphodiesterase class I)